MMIIPISPQTQHLTDQCWCHVCWDMDQTSRFGSPPIWRTFWHPRFSIFFAWAANSPGGVNDSMEQANDCGHTKYILDGWSRKILLGTRRFGSHFYSFYPRSSAVMFSFWLASASWTCSVASSSGGQPSVAQRGTSKCIFCQSTSKGFQHFQVQWSQNRNPKTWDRRPGSETPASFFVVGQNPLPSGPWRKASTPDHPWNPWHLGSLMAACWAGVELPPENVFLLDATVMENFHYWGSGQQFMKVIVEGGHSKLKHVQNKWPDTGSPNVGRLSFATSCWKAPQELFLSKLHGAVCAWCKRSMLPSTLFVGQP